MVDAPVVPVHPEFAQPPVPMRATPPKPTGPITMIQVRIPATIHKPGPEYTPLGYHPNGAVIEGFYDIETVPPNTPFEIEEKEGLALVAKFAHLGAEVVIKAREERRAKMAHDKAEEAEKTRHAAAEKLGY